MLGRHFDRFISRSRHFAVPSIHLKEQTGCVYTTLTGMQRMANNRTSGYGNLHFRHQQHAQVPPAMHTSCSASPAGRNQMAQRLRCTQSTKRETLYFHLTGSSETCEALRPTINLNIFALSVKSNSDDHIDRRCHKCSGAMQTNPLQPPCGDERKRRKTVHLGHTQGVYDCTTARLFTRVIAAIGTRERYLATRQEVGTLRQQP